MIKTITEKPITFLNHKRERLFGILSLPRVNKKVPVVILVHGFSKTKSERKFVEMSRKLAQDGIAAFRFDFSGCGDSEGRFEKMTILKQVKELNSAFGVLIKEKRIDKKRVGIFAHSLGTVTSVLFQEKYKKAKTLVLAALALNQERLIKKWHNSSQIRKWKKQKYLDTPKFRTGIGYLNETKNYTNLLSKVKIPTLVFHGGQDEDIPENLAKKDFQKIGSQNKKMIIIKKADHHFEDYFSKHQLIKNSSSWFSKYL